MSVEVLAQWKMVSASGDAADDIINTWSFRIETSPPPAATLLAIKTALETFYTNLKTAFSSQQYTGAWTLKIYNRADPTPRAPIVTYTGTITSLSASASMPPEVTQVLSFQGTRVSGQPQSRRRGRVYLPTLIASTYTTGGMLNTALQTSIKDEANALLTASDAAADWTWVIFSEVNSSSVPVHDGWVDNAADIQRRRGRKPTTRATFP